MGFSNRHAASLTNTEAVGEALIGVENIYAPILLLSGGMDDVWPATEMASKICARVNAATSSSCTHINFENGDHLLNNNQTASFDEVEEFLNSVSQ